jgi:predicted HicB family RNase H-like nuclease
MTIDLSKYFQAKEEAETRARNGEVDVVEKTVSKMTTMRLPSDLHTRLGTEAKKRGVGVSALIRQFIEAGLSEEVA